MVLFIFHHRLSAALLFLIDFHCFKASMKQIFTDGNNYPKLEIEKNRWTGRWWRMIAIIISVCSLTVFSVVQLFNGKIRPPMRTSLWN